MCTLTLYREAGETKRCSGLALSFSSIRRKLASFPHEQLIKRLRNVVLSAGRHTGILNVVRDSNWRRQRLLVLCYHGISIDDEHEWHPCAYMPQELLRERLNRLKRGAYSVLPFEEAVERLYAGNLPPRSVTLTFDEGKHNFRTRACPVLSEFGFPATVYLPTYYAVHRYPVFRVLFSYLLWKGRDRTISLAGIIPGGGTYSLGAKQDRDRTLNLLLAFIAGGKVSNEQRSDMSCKLSFQTGVDYEHLCQEGIFHLMGPDELRELQGYGVSIQLHTHRHRSFDDEGTFRREIRENRAAIEDMGVQGPPLEHFCYPNGTYFRSCFSWLRAEKIRTATTCQPGLASRSTNALLLPRLVDTCSMTPLEFEGWLSGVSHLLPRRQQPVVRRDPLADRN